MLPSSLLSCRTCDGVAQPSYFSAADRPWLRCLIDERERFVGHRERALHERLSGPLPMPAPEDKRRIAAHVLRLLGRPACVSQVRPVRAREAVFGAAARQSGSREAVFSSVAESLGVATDALREALFADVPGERRVTSLDGLTTDELAIRCNLALAQGLLHRSSRIDLALVGNARPVVRQAKLRRLICVVHGHAGDGLVRMEISGVLSLFHHTLVYGRALAELIPLLAWCRDFRLDATCVIRGRQVRYQLRGGDPVFPSTPPRIYDSQVEARFARDFGRAASDWDVIREPEPILAGSRLLFPDFALRHRAAPEHYWLVEIVGFFTPEYLRNKLNSYREAGLTNLILCVDDSLSCAPGELPRDAHVVWFRRRVDAGRVLAFIETRASPTMPSDTANRDRSRATPSSAA